MDYHKTIRDLVAKLNRAVGYATAKRMLEQAFPEHMWYLRRVLLDCAVTGKPAHDKKL